MNLRVRRIYRTGGSVGISLPPDWLLGNSLEPGDQVEIWYNGEVHVRPKRKKKGVQDGVQPVESSSA